jgi:hypothetical protein
MRLAIWANLYDNMNSAYFDDWRKGLAQQIDHDYEILYSTLEGGNDCLQKAVEDYDAILCLDVDDIPEPALTHVAKISARDHDITAFAMKMVDQDNKGVIGYFGKMVDVSAYNIWGFGNTVFTSEALRRLLPIDFKTYPPDWELAKKAHGLGTPLYFERLPLIRYRQYGQNDRLVKLGDAWVWGKLENFESEPE